MRENSAMGFHHVALAVRDSAATHRFYTEVMGFKLAKVVAGPTPGEHGGWSKHFFYDTTLPGETQSGDAGLIAFWELHDSVIGEDYEPNLNKAAGLPGWVNHFAFDAPTMDVLHERRDHWRSHGQTVVEIDHGFCSSIYINDPDGNMVEFCCTTEPFTEHDHQHGLQVLADPAPAFEDGEPTITFHKPLVPTPA
jgi:catechol 2,3-dioxygenase-like lactoylglutathione lyase family enzyme